MNLYKSQTYREDLDYVLEQCGWISRLEGTAVLITGASGLICSAAADLLLRWSELHGGCIRVYAAGRNEKTMRARFSRYQAQPYFQFVPYNAAAANHFGFSTDYLIHGASNAYPAAIQEHPIETMKDNFSGLLELLEYASTNVVRNTVFLSSSEVYGKKDTMEPFTEEEYGFVDILNPRSSYSESKRAAETLCASFAQEKKLPVSIIRPGHIYGPTASKQDNRVSSAFAYDAAAGKDLLLKSNGSQIRSYCYMLDCATAILKVLLDGGQAQAYNVSNPDSVMSIREMALLYAKHAGVRLGFDRPDEKEKAAFNPMQNSSLNGGKLKALGWKGLFDSDTGTEHTIRILKEAQEA